jgi:iron-sulfur cluster repair protein YtfE (RIC family)
MPDQPRIPPAEDCSEQVFEHLLDGHARIREHSLVALRLARHVEAPSFERSAAARRLLQYFTEGYRRHVADEDQSLAPRLIRLGLSPRGLEALLEMSREHADIEALLVGLTLVWTELADLPERHPALEPDLTQNSERLAAWLESHLFMEEQSIFPEARTLLPPEEARAALAEMRARWDSEKPGGGAA